MGDDPPFKTGCEVKSRSTLMTGKNDVLQESESG